MVPVKTQTNATQRRQDEAVLLLIKGLSYLAAQARAAQLGPAARLLDTAREDMADWAAARPCRRHAADKAFIDEQLFATGLFPAAGFALQFQGIKDAAQRKLIAELFGLAG